MTVSAVIVTYNRLDMLREVLSALQNSKSKIDHIIVIDNASSNDTQRYLTELKDQIEYIRLSENIGGAGGFNKGIRYFMEHTDDEYVWLMDDDTVPTPEALTELLLVAKKRQFGFLASDVRWIDGQRALMNMPAPLNRFDLVPDHPTKEIKLRSATFVSLLMPRDVVQRIGLPITEFFIWGDDIEYTERARRVAPGYLVPKAVVMHKMASNVGSNIITDSAERTKRYYFAYRNKMYYARQRGFMGYFKGQIRIGLELLRLVFWPRRVENRWGKIKVILHAIQDGRRFNPHIEYVHDRL
ncbi:glycosyltransferase [Weissella muntiaci]|uniref:Glycosyltransferase n=1 Tax=Weissella muntiaci TaxID=2508881 RepID=A0A6C2C2C0_9LACO|nr:glycosyltransferase family 2 protein [Weissella muntiaci]TYC48094.1 glycosyltransferase [Weissella muntiaci]